MFLLKYLLKWRRLVGFFMAGKIKWRDKTKTVRYKPNRWKKTKSNEEHNAIISIPRIIKPIRIAIPVRPVPIRIRHIPVAIGVTNEGTIMQRPSRPLPARGPTQLSRLNIIRHHNAPVYYTDFLSFFSDMKHNF